MNQHRIQIVEPGGRLLATAVVETRADRLMGAADLSDMPANWRRHFEEYERIVNGQIFSVLDDIEDQIRGLRLRVEFDDATAEVEDLQLFPSTGRISFRVAKLLPKRPALV